MEDFNGKFEEIDPRLIVVDHRYQRPEKETLIATISQDFKWPSFGVITCFSRNNTYYAVDGQQRLEAAKSLNPVPKKVPVLVFPEATLELEAESFLDIQVNRKAVASLEKHKAELLAKNPAALAIERAADKAGFSIAKYPGDTNARTVSAIRTLHYTYTQLGEEGVVQVLVQGRESWPNDKEGHSAQMLHALTDLIVEQGEKYNRQKMTTALKRSTPGDIMRQSRGFEFDKGGSRQVNIRRALKFLCKI